MRIIFAAGGTGGHVNPAIAAAQEVRKRDPGADILFIGTNEKIESKLVPAAGFDFRAIKVTGFKRSFSPGAIIANIKALILVIIARMDAKKIIKEFAPDAVVGFGGYVSGPVVSAAARMGIPTAVHEQNSFPGVTNKKLAPQVDKVMLTTADAEKYLNCKNKPVLTGLPVRAGIAGADRAAARAELCPGDETLILSFGGSLGARTINNCMLGLFGDMKDVRGVKFIHSYGTYAEYKDYPERLKAAGLGGEDGRIKASSYIEDMDKCLAAADIVICRAGASTLAELEAAGRAAVLIPSPNVAENHQYYNAMTLVNAGAAEVIEEKDLTGNALLEKVSALCADPGKRAAMSGAAAGLAVTDAASRIADEIESIIK